MPILYSDRLAGKLDTRPTGRLAGPRVDAIHQNIPGGKTTSAAYARRPGIWLAGWNRTSPACMSGSPHRAPRTAGGERAPGFPYLPRAGMKDHSFRQGRVSGLTLSSIVAVNRFPSLIRRAQIRVFRWDSSRHIEGGYTRVLAGPQTVV